MPDPLASPSSPGIGRLIVAFAMLPVVQALVAFLAFPLVWWMGGHGDGRPIDQAPMRFALLTGFIGLFVTLAGAVPVVLVLVQRGRASLRRLLLVGLLLGNAPFALYVVGLIVPATMLHLVRGTMSAHLLTLPELIAGVTRALLLGSSFGLMSAALFWHVGVRRWRGGRA